MKRILRPKMRRLLVGTIALATLFYASVGLGGPQIPGFYGQVPNLPKVAPNALPSVKGIVQGVSSVDKLSDNQLIIHQNREKAIIDWHSFNIGEQASTHFDQQKNTNWAALNRIYDKNPSQILGKLSADGRIYLINQNGILFGPNSRVNVHSLVASSLNMTQDDFLRDRLKFSTEDMPAGVVANHGLIRTDKTGSVFLLAPTVENSGTIEAPGGQIALAAGDDIELTTLETASRLYPFIYVTPGDDATATNFQGGQMIADAGLAGLYGRIVRQEGLIRSVTAISNSGRIELHASQKVTTGPESQTATPVSNDTERVHKSFQIQGGEIHTAGLDEKVLINNTYRNKTTATERIEHYGDMTAPSGTVIMNAKERIYLGRKSRIDVAGLWTDSVDPQIVSVQLNSMELKNDYGQARNILQGETVEVNPYEGSAVGDISGALNFEFLTAREMSTKGGTVKLSAPAGDIIVREGAEIDFSGGGTHNAGETIETTRLVTTTGKVYDIAEALQWVSYDSILNDYTKLHERYGISETFEGLYYGGASPARNYIDSHMQGDDAGALILEAKGIVLDGRIYGWATRGILQTDITVSEEMFDGFAVQTDSGRKQPRGGSLIVGVEKPVPVAGQKSDFVAEEVVVASDAPRLPDDFGPDDSLKTLQINGERPYVSEYSDGQGPLYRTVLSSQMLNRAKLSDLSINVNTKVTIEENAVLALHPGGLRIDETVEYLAGMPLQYLHPIATATFTIRAQALDHRGRISVPSGEFLLMLRDTVASPKMNNPAARIVPINQRAYLAEGSSVSAAGDKIDNSLVGVLTEYYQGHIDGGKIQIMDSTGAGAETILSPGAILDVSAGYVLAPDGVVTAGEAGTLRLEGSTLLVGADLRGYALPDNPGGHISFHATELTIQNGTPDFPTGVAFDTELPPVLQSALILGDDQLEQTGFTHITLKSYRDLTIQDGVTLTPSYIKMMIPSKEKSSGAVSPGKRYTLTGIEDDSGFATVPADYIGSSSITAKAGEALTGSQSIDRLVDTYAVKVSEASALEVAPGGGIELSGLVLDLAGTLKAPAGNITLTARGIDRDLTVRGTARILAPGWTLPERTSLAKGLPVGYRVLDGGTVSLTAKDGNIDVEPGAVIDVSGSALAKNFMRTSTNRISTIATAGAAGGLNLTYFGGLNLDGVINGKSSLPNVHGASLSITKLSDWSGLVIGAAALRDYQESGFDALTLRSLKELTFADSMDVRLNRSLTLDAPLINLADGSEHADIRLQAPWITLGNTRSKYGSENEEISYRLLVKDEQALEPGAAHLSLSGGWIDIVGSIGLSGFGDISLSATRDMTLTDQPYYGVGGTVAWSGKLRTPGDLIARASRIYPTTLSDFTLASDGGRITILPGEKSAGASIYSAGGSLTIEASEIDHQGYLAAPMGRLFLLSDKETGAPARRIQLGPDSVTSVACNAVVQYGNLEDIYWNISEKPKDLTSKLEVQAIAVEGLPESLLEIAGDAVIIQDGAHINISGGGSIFGYEFRPGIAGLANPFQMDGRSVVVPKYSVPGEAVYLNGGAGLPAGTYALLPEQYAFLPGAYVIEDLGPLLRPEEAAASKEGYSVVTGYASIMDTGFRNTEPHGYAVRKAQEVFKEGDFNVGRLDSGAPGRLVVRGTTTILDGKIKANALSGFEGGFAAITGAQSAVVRARTSLPAEFSFQDTVPEQFFNKAIIKADGLSGLGVTELHIGTLDITETVTFEEGATLKARGLTLAGRNAVTLERNSNIQALGPEGSVSLLATEGMVTVEEGARVEVSDTLSIVSKSLGLHGKFQGRDSILNVKTDKVFIVENDDGGPDPDGYHLTETLKGLEGFTDITLAADTSLNFTGDIHLIVEKTLTLNTPQITGQGIVKVQSGAMRLFNTGEAATGMGELLVEKSRLTFSCEDMTVGHGDIVVVGFSDVGLSAENDIIFSGEGSLMTGGDLELSAARVTMSPYPDPENGYETARFVVQAGDADRGYHDIVIAKNGGIPGEKVYPGGSLDIRGRDIEVGTIIEIPAGWIGLEAMGAAIDGYGIRFNDEAAVLASGTAFTPGGRVNLRTEQGTIQVEDGSHIDVSAGEQGDAGKITLYAPMANIVLHGTIDGRANHGSGGTLQLDAGNINDFSGVIARAASGGFDESLDFRVRNGNVTIAETDTIRARHVEITADDVENTGGDNGNLNILGTIDAAGKEGGSVELAAANSLRVYQGASIVASATDADKNGGNVFLSTAAKTIFLAPGSVIDVSGGASGQGGQVHLRAPRTASNDDVAVTMAGAIRGGSELVVEGVKYYEYEGDVFIQGSHIGNYNDDSDVFMDHAADIEERLRMNLVLDETGAGGFRVAPGVEVRSTGDLVLATDWDLTNERYGDGKAAGFLTLRAARDLTLNRSLVDHPTDITLLNDTLVERPGSWGLNLVAGSDLQSADIMATCSGTGDFTISDGQLAYTENGALRFASGRDTTIGSPPGFLMHKYMVNWNMTYSMATFTGSVEGTVGRDLTFDANGAIQSATGDIIVSVGRNLSMELGPFSGSAIRTTGNAPPDLQYFGLDWRYSEAHDGGDIALDVGGELAVDQLPFFLSQNLSTPHLLYWDNVYPAGNGNDDMRWSADYGTFFAGNVTLTSGVATMGGGSVTVQTGRDLFCQIGTFKEGNLKVFANGDISGYFQVANGEGTITAMGNIHSVDPDTFDTSLALFDARVAVTAYGHMDFGTIFNPTFQRNIAEYHQQMTPLSNLDYSEKSSVALTSVGGDLALSGAFWKERFLRGVEANDDKARRVLPPIVTLSAQGDIHLGSVRGGDFLLAPSSTGNLQINAGGTVSGLYADSVRNPKRAVLRLSDLRPENIYGRKMINYDVLNALWVDESREVGHATTPIHLNDPIPSTLTAGNDIRELVLITPERTVVEAGGDITGLYFFGQNLHPTDVTAIRAKGDIRLNSVTLPILSKTGYRLGGAGQFLVQAGESVDLGTTQGIQTVGNAFYTALSEQDSTLTVMAGIYKDIKAGEIAAFFEDLKDYGVQYSESLANGDTEGAAAIVQETQETLIEPFLHEGVLSTGNIDMTSSSINTSAESSDIYIVAAGNINVGLTTLPDPSKSGSEQAIAQETGIFTAKGGGINIFSVGDLNVNESRVMTFRSGDIVSWIDQGDINAGRGSKTAINTGNPKVIAVKDDDGNVISKKIEWEPPAVGSGIRTLTYDPDGALGPLTAPEAGDAYLFAPQGIIDAGEAGIAAKNVILGATEVLNVQNIDVSGVSVGVPSTADAGPSLGALAGVGNITETSSLTENAAAMNEARERMAQDADAMAKAFTPTWLRVEFVGFEEETTIRDSEQ